MKRTLLFSLLMLLLGVSNLVAQNGIVAAPGQTAQGTPPTAAVVVQGQGIDYFGGPVMVNPHHVYFIWYGNWSGNTALNILPDFINGLDASPYFSIDTTYTDGSGTPIKNRVSLSAQAFDNYSQGTVLSAPGIQNVVVAAIQGGQLPADPDGIYFVLSSADVDMNAGFCSALCGFHTFSTIAGADIKYGWVGDPDFCTAHGRPACTNFQQGSVGPNGNHAADGMANFMAHELNETVTDPHINAWLDPFGNEVGDKCNFNFGSNIFTAPNGASANVQLGGRNFMIQQTWINAGGGMCSMGLSLVPTPSIMSISPAQASRGSSVVTVNINGSSLFGATPSSFKFSLGGLPSTAISVNNVLVAQDGSVIAADITVCGAPAGVYDLAIETANGISKTQPFTVAASGPVMNDTAPRSGAPGTSFPITFLGCALENTSSVTAQAPGITFSSISSTSTQVTATMNIASSTGAGPYLLDVANLNGTSSITFNVVAGVPFLTSLSPTSQTAGSTFTLTLMGSNLANVSSVTFNPSAGITVSGISASANQVTANVAIAPSATVGSYTVQVANPQGSSNGLMFSVGGISGPTINNLSPTSVLAGSPAFTLTVNGGGFVSGAAVQFGGANLTTTFINAGQLTALVPASAVASAGNKSVTVANPPQGNNTTPVSNAVVLTVNNPVPAITSLSPSSAIAGSGTFILTVNGANFVNGSLVEVNGSNQTTSFVSSTQITASIPASDVAAAGTFSVTVFNPAPGGGTSPASSFIVSPNTQLSISPSSVVAGSGAFTLTVNGSGFMSGATVQVSGVSRATTFASSSQLTAGILAGDVASPGTLAITVLTGSGTLGPVSLTVIPAPNFSVAVVPASLSVVQGESGGATVTITSLNGFNSLTNLSASQVSGVTSAFLPPSVTPPAGGNASSTLSLAVSPSAAAGTTALTITGVSGSISHSASLTLTVTAANNPVPSISSISPSTVFSSGGDFTLTINGSGFVTSSIVNVSAGNSSGPRATTFVSASQLTIQITSSDTANSGQITVSVTNQKPGGGTSNSAVLNVF